MNAHVPPENHTHTKEDARISSLGPDARLRYKKIQSANDLIRIIIMISLTLLVYFNIRIGTVPSSSMYPTLTVKEFCLIDVVHNPDELEYGDIVVFNHHSPRDGKVQYVKRLIGKAGDTIEVCPTGVIRNGIPIHEPYCAERYTAHLQKPIIIKDGDFFMMGDNRNNSSDSRVWGAVKKEDIIGVVRFHRNFFGDPDAVRYMESIIPEFRNQDFSGDFPDYTGPDYDLESLYEATLQRQTEPMF